MTQKEKIKSKFLENPKSLSYSKIINFLVSEGYEYNDGKGSHKKFKHLKSSKSQVVAVHNNETKDIYKVLLRDFYINNLEKDEK